MNIESTNGVDVDGAEMRFDDGAAVGPVLARLRACVASDEVDARAAGRRVGTEWARDAAGPIDLESFVESDIGTPVRLRLLLVCGSMTELATTEEISKYCPEDDGDGFPVHGPYTRYFETFADGFVDGATEVWEVVRDHL